MNPFSHNPLPPDHDEQERQLEQQRQFDLLVDGELSAAERRQLLISLDEQPGGWRRCALAFLEAQSWGDDLRAIAQPAASPPVAALQSASPPQVQPVQNTRSWRSHNLGLLAALAASVLLCFGLGFRTHDWWQAARPVGLAGNGPSPSFPSLPADQVAAGSRAGRQPVGRQSVGRTNGLSGNSATDQVTFVLDGAKGADAAAMEVPVFGQQFWAGNPQAAGAQVPADVLRALERLGKVRQHQQLVPVRLNDGREAIVPVNRIELEPVNLRNYQ